MGKGAKDVTALGDILIETICENQYSKLLLRNDLTIEHGTEKVTNKIRKELKGLTHLSNGKIIMATVKGDVHDIGKNIEIGRAHV